MKYLTPLFLLLILIWSPLYGQYSSADVVNVNYENIGFTGDVKISYDLIGCSTGSLYYAYVYFEEDELRKRTLPSDHAVEGTGKDAPVRCGYNRSVIWRFSREPYHKRLVGGGEFVVEVFEVPQSEVRIVTRLGRVDEKILRAEANGKDRRVRRLERRRQRIVNRHIRRHGY